MYTVSIAVPRSDHEFSPEARCGGAGSYKAGFGEVFEVGAFSLMCTCGTRNLGAKFNNTKASPGQEQPTLCANLNLRRKQKKRAFVRGKGVTVCDRRNDGK